jgi:hypothetical protein
MKKIIRKNCRRPFPYFNIPEPIVINKNKDYSITKYFKFTESALYHFGDQDQHDVNKLFGFSFGLHHKNSVRFGWRPNNDLTKIEIVGYEYVNKIRVPTIPIWDVEIDKWYQYELRYISGVFGKIEYFITDGNDYRGTIHPITLPKDFYLGYKLYLYFGGNKKAPHDIIIYQDNK